MRFKIHYTIKGVEDHIIISGRSILEIQKKADKEMKKRGVDTSTCWSEEL